MPGFFCLFKSCSTVGSFIPDLKREKVKGKDPAALVEEVPTGSVFRWDKAFLIVTEGFVIPSMVDLHFERMAITVFSIHCRNILVTIATRHKKRDPVARRRPGPS